MEKDLSTWTVKQLKDHLRKLGLTVSGNKAELIRRAEYAEVSQSEYSEMKVPQLKLLLKERKLAQTGRKAELINRLEANDTTNIAELPNEIFKEVLHNLEDEDLAKTCRTDKRAAEVCKDDLFWYERIKRKIKYDLKKYKEPDLSYRTMYKFLKEQHRIGHKLRLAAKLGYLPLVKYIIEVTDMSSTDINIRGLIASKEDITPIVKYLIETYGGYDLNSLLLEAVENKKLEVVKYLIEKGADIYYEGEDFDVDSDYTAFTMAAYVGALDILKYVIKHKKPDDEIINSAMHAAVNAGKLSTVKYLIEKQGATDLNTALLIAIDNDKLSLVKYLVKTRADIAVGLEAAEDLGRFKIVDYLESL